MKHAFKGLFVGGVKLPLALAELGLSRLGYASGAVAMRYEPRR
jgi:hypothetical protein